MAYQPPPEAQEGGLPTTGHAVRFANHGTYFDRLASSGASPVRPPASPGTPRYNVPTSRRR